MEKLKQLKNILMMMKIVNSFKNKKKYLSNFLIDKRLDEITKLNKKVNFDYLIYRYKGKTAD